MKSNSHITRMGLLGVLLAGSVMATDALAADGYGTDKPTTTGSSSTRIPNTKQSSDVLSWEDQNRYWQQNYTSRPYYRQGAEYDAYEPAYRYGYESSRRYKKPYGELSESELQQGWEEYDDRSNMKWNEVRDAVRDSYNRGYDSGYQDGVDNDTTR